MVLVLVRIWRPKNEEHWFPKGGEDGWLSLSERSQFVLLISLCPIRALSRLEDADLNWWQWSQLSLLIQMLVASRNTLTDTHRNVSQLSGYPLAQSIWHVTITQTLSVAQHKLKKSLCHILWDTCFQWHCLNNFETTLMKSGLPDST